MLVPNIVQCPSCGRDNPSYEFQCSTCGKPLAIYIGPARQGTYSLGSIMMMIAAISLGLGVLRASVWLGIVVLSLVMPALGRLLYYKEQDRAWSNPMQIGDQFRLFMGSIMIMLVIEISMLVMFFIILSLILLPGMSSGSWIIGVLVAGLSALAVGVWLGRKLLRRNSF